MVDFTKAMADYLATEIQTIQALDLTQLNAAANAILDARNRGRNDIHLWKRRKCRHCQPYGLRLCQGCDRMPEGEKVPL